ncbi:UNVERIFIED_CONTAM: hypothetical protein FKN15_064924 [Acipenser sinensis]
MGSPVSTFVSVDPATGSIYALRNLNYEVVKQLQLRIQASDGGSPQLHSTAVINVKIVDQNDNAPSVIHPVLINGSAEVLVPRDAPSGYLITKIKASDADQGINSELTYTIGREEQHVAFSINKVTGEIYLNREISHEYREVIKITITVSDNGRPSLSSTATLHFIITTTAPHSGHVVVAQSPEDNKLFHMDMSVIVIIVLAGSCTLLLLAIILIATTCNRRKKEKETTGFRGDVDVQMGNGRNNRDTLISSHSGSAFDSRPYCSKSSFSNSHTTESDMCSSCEDGRDCMYEAENRLPGSNTESYSALPGFGVEVVRPIAIWKGNSFSTIPARDPEFSGKDSGKGDSDFNDSDSDVSGDGQKKAVVPGNVHNGLWACTSECKVLGHSDRCWSPSAMRASANNSSHTSQSLSSLAKTASLPRETLRRENYYQAHLPKTVGLQSVYEKVLHIDYDYVLVSPPRPVRIQEISETAVSVYAPTTTTSHTNNV